MRFGRGAAIAAPTVIALAVVTLSIGGPARGAALRPPQEQPDGLERPGLVKEGQARDPEDWFHQGTRQLQQGEFSAAREALKRAAAGAEGKLEEDARYNLGLAFARPVEAKQEKPEERGELLQQAREAFRAVLRRSPDSKDARWNLELVDRWLEQARSQDGRMGQRGRQGGAMGQGTPTHGQASGSYRDQQVPSLSMQQADSLLQVAAGSEAEAQGKKLDRGKYQDPAVERNW